MYSASQLVVQFLFRVVVNIYRDQKSSHPSSVNGAQTAIFVLQFQDSSRESHAHSLSLSVSVGQCMLSQFRILVDLTVPSACNVCI